VPHPKERASDRIARLGSAREGPGDGFEIPVDDVHRAPADRYRVQRVWLFPAYVLTEMRCRPTLPCCVLNPAASSSASLLWTSKRATLFRSLKKAGACSNASTVTASEPKGGETRMRSRGSALGMARGAPAATSPRSDACVGYSTVSPPCESRSS